MLKRKGFLRFCTFALAICLCLGFQCPLLAATDVKVFLDGKQVTYDVPPQIINSRTMVPLSLTIQQFTHVVPDWNDATKTVSFQSNGHTCVHTVGSKLIYIDGNPVEYDTPSLIVDSRTLVPIRMIADSTGATTTWDGASRTVIITSPEGAPTKATKAAIISLTPNASNPAMVTQGESGQIIVVANSHTTRVKLVNDSAAAEELIVKDYYVQGSNRMFTINWAPGKVGESNPKIYAGDDKAFSDSYQSARLTVVTNNVADIIEASPTSSVVDTAGSVTVKIITNTAVTKVWLNVPQESDILHATTGFTTAGNQRTWTLTWKPKTTGHKECYAYGSDDKGNKDYYQFKVDVTEASSSRVSVSGVSANRTVITPGETVTVTVTTSSSAKRVWAEYEDQTVTAKYQQADSSGKSVWTFDCTPKLVSATITVSVFADDSTGKDIATGSLSIKIQADPSTEYPSITALSAEPSSGVVPGASVAVNVTTNAATTEVTVQYVGGASVKAAKSQTLSNGNIVWTATVATSASQSGKGLISAYATNASGSYDDDNMYIYFS